ncbi:SAVED domain-containing protein [Micrococcus luteus]|nr:SAVED domain-containing protein [Micrococcus luteus]
MSSGRVSVSREEELKVYVRAGGRCCFCQAYLVEGQIAGAPMKIGEMAHIVGAKISKRSPRGEDPLPQQERDKAENLMLVCRGEHKEIDRVGASDWATVDKLRRIKADHEGWIRRVTGLDRSRHTTVLRFVGDVRGNAVDITKAAAAGAVLLSGDRYPKFPLSADDFGFEIDIRAFDETSPDYWQRAAAHIDRIIDHKLRDEVTAGRVDHVSVFAFALLPLLVHLGSKLDDTFATDVYDNHRVTRSWEWPDSEAAARFETSFPADPSSADEAVFVLNVSGSISDAEVPAALADLPQWTLALAGATPGPGPLRSAADLAAFSAASRGLLAEVERRAKHTRRLHVLAALPLSAAIELGRVHDAHVHPRLAVYHRADGGYKQALELS